ncbi:MAG: SDR family oxidoreductase [Candidatus Tectomicrobia bacterium]|uniref:SDR family oxidoreductase n=1 Tax=Tectimicrobiota bacterium TaxID=2528274 RepID=A0A933GMY1_UNCTE|nr:SDR family oxidoreductase [Candidatus Tectomicrobia bacterium]
MSLKEFDLTGKSAVVMGGGRGIGKGIALTLAEAGADVLVAARTNQEILETAAEIGQLGCKGLAVAADATKSSEIDHVISVAIKEFGKIDILVNSAGAGLRKPIVPLPGYKAGEWAGGRKDISLPVTDLQWQQLIDANMTSIFLATRAVGLHMLERKKGKIINISSMTGAKGFPTEVIYCTTKAAVIMYTRALALEWARYHINVNSIAPGYVETEMTSQFFDNEKTKERLLSSVPLRRLCQPREVGLLAVYLASEASDYLTGQAIYLDGGILA